MALSEAGTLRCTPVPFNPEPERVRLRFPLCSGVPLPSPLGHAPPALPDCRWLAHPSLHPHLAASSACRCSRFLASSICGVDRGGTAQERVMQCARRASKAGDRPRRCCRRCLAHKNRCCRAYARPACCLATSLTTARGPAGNPLDQVGTWCAVTLRQRLRLHSNADSCQPPNGPQDRAQPSSWNGAHLVRDHAAVALAQEGHQLSHRLVVLLLGSLACLLVLRLHGTAHLQGARAEGRGSGPAASVFLPRAWASTTRGQGGGRRATRKSRPPCSARCACALGTSASRGWEQKGSDAERAGPSPCGWAPTRCGTGLPRQSP